LIKVFEGRRIVVDGMGVLELYQGELGWYLDIDQSAWMNADTLYIGIKEKDGTHYMDWREVNRGMQRCTTYHDVEKFYDDLEAE
jgi:hypothetical protein